MVSVSDCTRKIIYVAAVLLYKFLLDIVYVAYIAPNYSYYMGMTADVDEKKLILSYLLTFVIALIMECNSSRLSTILMNVQFLVTLIPMLSFYAVSNRNSTFMLGLCFIHIFQSLFLRMATRMEKSQVYITLVHNKLWLILTVAGLLFCSIGYSVFNYGTGSLGAFDFENVYEIREGISYGFPFSYFIPWTFKVVCLFLLLYFLESKNYVGAMLAGAVQLYFYMVYANKATLFSLGLVLGTYILVKKFDVIFGILVGLIGLIMVSGLAYAVFNSMTLLSYLVRRSLFMPAVIKFAYYDFFVENEKVHFADNSIGHLFGITSPYEWEAPKLIAKYLKVPDSYCNTGYWGDAFANGGWFCVILFSVVIVMIIMLMERLSEAVPKGICVPIFVALFYNLNDSALLTWILGGGGALILGMLWLCRNYKKREAEYAKV